MSIRSIYIFFHKIIAALILPKSTRVDLRSVKRILIYATIGIGDMVIFSPALKAMRKRFPSAHISILVSHSNCEEVVKGSQLINEILYFKPSWWNMLTMAYRIYISRYDILINSYLCRSIHLNNITLLSGIPIRVGHGSSPDWHSENDYLFNIQVPILFGMHESKRALSLAEAIQCTHDDSQPYFHLDQQSEAFADLYFETNNLSNKWVLAVQVGTVESQIWKQWDLKKVAEVCDYLLSNDEVKIILLGSRHHQHALDVVTHHMKQTPLILAGKSSLKESASIIKRCKATLCNDSGLMHVSSAVGTPVIATFGPTDPNWTAPSGNIHKIIRKEMPCSPCYNDMSLSGMTALNCDHHNCLNTISVQDVLNAVESLKNERK